MDVHAKISDYGLIGNCRTAALVSKRGSIDWCCFPKFDSPSHFARILDPSGGHFSLAPTAPFESSQSYLEDTNVLVTTFTCDSGSAVLTDLIPVKARDVCPNELWPDEEILRIVEVSSGEVEFALELLPRSQYGQRGIQIDGCGGGWGVRCSDGRKNFYLQCSGAKLQVQNTPLGPVVRKVFKVQSGERVIVSLSYADEAPAVIPPLETALDRRDHTIRYWKNWCASTHPEHQDSPYNKIIQRSALALKLLNYAPSGAFVAAPTTSLPEWIGGARNWDYRFCWLRDAAFTTRALTHLGHLDEAKAFLNWLLHTTRLTWPHLQVLYTVYGESKVPERIAHWMAGFRGSKPVRLGNLASTQLQLDVYGEVIDSFYSLAEHLHPIDRETQKMVIGFGRAVTELWERPDQGIWEMRMQPRHYTHSKVMCWVAMDRLAKLSRRYNWRLPYDPEQVALEIRERIESLGFDPKSGCYVRSFGELELDASLLVMPLVGYCEADSPRFVSTREAIIQRLGHNGLLYRYAPGSDGLPDPEGAFALCNFWLAEAYARAGDLPKARQWFSAVVQSLVSTGVSSEELNPEQGEYLGNHPQGFSHVGLINAALAIEEVVEKGAA